MCTMQNLLHVTSECELCDCERSETCCKLHLYISLIRATSIKFINFQSNAMIKLLVQNASHLQYFAILYAKRIKGNETLHWHEHGI